VKVEVQEAMDEEAAATQGGGELHPSGGVPPRWRRYVRMFRPFRAGGTSECGGSTPPGIGTEVEEESDAVSPHSEGFSHCDR
jgi:hypothetical protein